MNKPYLVLTLVLCCALGLGLAGCTDLTTTTTASETTTAAVTTTTAAPRTTLPASTTTGATTGTTVAATTTTTVPRVWTNLSPAGTLPPAGVGQVMAYDSNRGKIILFGGADLGTYFNDTWEYDPAANAWTKLDPLGGLPPVRNNQAMAYDSVNRKVVIFGGWNGSTPMNDTWAYDPSANTWTDMSPAGSRPPARDNGFMVYDSARGKLILFGGWDGSTFFSDTWAYELAANTWTNLSPAGSLPAARLTHSMVFDSNTGKVLLYGGWREGSTDLNDIWAYDPSANAWTDLGPAGSLPAAREGQSMAYDSAANQVILFGGADASRTFYGDTWAYDPAANRWTELHPAGAAPSARVGPSMVYDSIGRKAILFGGWTGGSAMNDTWSYGRP